MPAFAGYSYPALAGPNQSCDAKSCARTEHDLGCVLFGSEAADLVDIGGTKVGSDNASAWKSLSTWTASNSKDRQSSLVRNDQCSW